MRETQTPVDTHQWLGPSWRSFTPLKASLLCCSAHTSFWWPILCSGAKPISPYPLCRDLQWRLVLPVASLNTYIWANSFSPAYLLTMEELRSRTHGKLSMKETEQAKSLPFRPDWSPASEKSMSLFLFFLMNQAPRCREQGTVNCWYDERVAWRYCVSQKGQERNC